MTRVRGYTMIDHEVHADVLRFAKDMNTIRRATALSQISEIVVQQFFPRVSLRWVLMKGVAF